GYIDIPEIALDAWQREDYLTLIDAFKSYNAPYQGEWKLSSLHVLPINKAIEMWNILSKEPHTGAKQVMLHLRLAGLTGFIHSASRYPQEALPVAQYFAAFELAPFIARAFNKLKTLRQDARSWLLKYPEHAITGLLPSALGKAGEAQDNARAALRM
ncbi:MolR family transcriptional regulator, partial [Escherichia coli]|nr:MolR family transcriptional regulator [Escherichia coli]